MDHLRPQAQDHLNKPDNQFVLISPDGVIVRAADKKSVFGSTEISEFPVDKNQAIFLGGKGQNYFFALPLISPPNAPYENIDLRSFAASDYLPRNEMGLIAEAVSVLKWQDSCKFCGVCGTQTKTSHGGWRKDCPTCGKQHFPRTDPVVIMLVTYQDKCLLGAGRDFKVPDRYSCLAGFVEPGETIEEAAKRELMEEAGVTAREVNYFFSQPWPFPSQLMIGISIEAASMDMSINKEELTDLKWFSKTDVEAVLKGATDRGFSLPTKIAIARNMLEIWVTS